MNLERQVIHRGSLPLGVPVGEVFDAR
jgi:hypothetical protein